MYVLYPSNLQQNFVTTVPNNTVYHIIIGQQANVLPGNLVLYNSQSIPKSDNNTEVICVSENQPNFIVQNSNSSGSSELHETPTDKKSPPIFQCRICDRTFTQLPHINNTEVICVSENQPNFIVQNSNSSGSSELHETPTDKKSPPIFHCRICDRTFTRNITLAAHKRIHSGERPFHCNVCKRRFTQQANLTKHMRIHSGERPYVCQICNKTFAQMVNLTKHIRIHTNEKPYECKVCSKSFSQGGNLAKHMRIHSGEKPYNCIHCSRTFLQKTNLERHERIHIGTKPFTCSICAKSFAQQANLFRHQATHTKKSRRNNLNDPCECG